MELLIDAGANVDVPNEVSVSSYIHIALIPGGLKYGLVLIILQSLGNRLFSFSHLFSNYVHQFSFLLRCFRRLSH